MAVRHSSARMDTTGGVLQRIHGAGVEMSRGGASPEWLQARWREVAQAIRTGDVRQVVAALKEIYDIAPEDTLVSMANRYLAGAK
jgi:hypothetical protein